MVVRALLVTCAFAAVAWAAPPSGYKCGAGKPDAGKGCICPAGSVDKRDDDNIAICAKETAAPMGPTCKKVATTIRDVVIKDEKAMREIPAASRSEFAAGVLKIIERRCAAGKWSKDVMTCFVGTKTADAIENCAKKLPEADYHGIDDDFEALAKSFDKKPPEKVSTQTDAELRILDKIFFETGSAKVAPISFPILDNVAAVMKDHPDLRLEVQGHLDNTEHSKTLGLSRAQAVIDYLTKHGVASARLTAKNYGPTQPIAVNKDAAGRAQNRRTEFRVLQ